MRARVLALALLALSSPVLSQTGDAASSNPASEAAAAILPAGSQLRLVTTQELTSKRQRKGDLVKLDLADDVFVDGQKVLAQGAPVVAQITKAEQSGLMGAAGRLEARVLYLDLPSGPVRLSGILGASGKSHTGMATAATALVSGFAFMIRGKSAVIPAGTELFATLDRDVMLSRSSQTDSETSASNP